MSTLLKIIWYCSLVYIPETIGLLLLISTGVQKKFRLDKATGCLLVFATGMYIISNFEHMEILFYLWNYLLLYLMYYFYTYYYTKKFKTAIYVVMAMYFGAFTIELILMAILSLIAKCGIGADTLIPQYMVAIGSIGTFFVCWLIYKQNKAFRMLCYVFEKNRMLGYVVIVAGSLCILGNCIFHMRDVLTDAESLLFISFAALFLIAMAQWKKEWNLNEEKDKRLSIQQMCRESYEQLMIEVRNRQHEFQNHLTALQGMAYTCHTLEELVEMQNQYCNRIVVENKYNRLLYGCKDPMIGGFLYSKFSKAQEEGKLKLSVENISPFIPSEQVADFFQRGSSSKEKNRGIGLAKLQKMVEKSGGRIIAQNIEKEGQNWLLMQVVLPFKGEK